MENKLYPSIELNILLGLEIDMDDYKALIIFRPQLNNKEINRKMSFI